MPIPSPLHERTAPLCRSWRFKEWAGYVAVSSYEIDPAPEYLAFRHAAGLMDVSPLCKLEISGPDAARLLSRLTVRDFSKLGVGRVAYCCWCDDLGKVVDDGTVTRLDEERYRLTSAEPSYAWVLRLARGHRVEVEDVTASLAALALQGPTSRAVLSTATDGAAEELRFFGARPARLAGRDVWITRTGYTGDLGYEIWTAPEDAVAAWDALVAAGRSHGLQPAGLDALDVCRIEAGFILLGADYHSAPRTVVESRKASPFELGLDWMVRLERGPFVGREALAAERERGPAWRLVGLELSWEELERLYDEAELPAAFSSRASREPLPVYAGDEQVGRATSHTWSPILKKPIALASVRAAHAAAGRRLEIEHTVEYERRRVGAAIADTPFFDPPRKRKP